MSNISAVEKRYRVIKNLPVGISLKRVRPLVTGAIVRVNLGGEGEYSDYADVFIPPKGLALISPLRSPP